MWTGHCDIWMLLLNLWSNHFWLLDWHLTSDSFFKCPFIHWIVLSWLLTNWHLFDPCWRADLIKWFVFKFRSITVSICIVDCIQLAQWDKIVVFGTWDLGTDLWSHQLLSVLSVVFIELTWDTVVFVKHGFGWRTEVYVLLYVEETDVSKILLLHL